MSDTITQAATRQQGGSAPPHPVRDLVLRLGQEADAFKAHEPVLAKTVQDLVGKLDDPRRLDNALFKTRVAYALQDVERLSGPIATVPPDLRAEMTALAQTAPGLDNKRLQNLVSATSRIDEPKLIRDIRDVALDAAFAARPAQDATLIDKIDALEHRTRLAGVAIGTIASPGPAQRATDPDASQKPDVTAHRSPAMDDVKRPSDSGVEPPVASGRDAPAQPQQSPNRREEPLAGRGAGLFSMMMASLIRNSGERREELDRQPTPIAERSEKHDAQFQQKQDAATIQAAERSQAAVLQAIRAFTVSSAASVLNRINDAAKSDPDGIAGVLAGMREGGKYAELRLQFNSGLASERGAQVAFERMTSGLGQYGIDRAAADAVGAKQNTLAAVAAKFESVDAEIGKATAAIPGKGDGKSVLDEVGDKIGDLLKRAADTIRAAFVEAKEGPAARSSPGPAPG